MSQNAILISRPTIVFADKARNADDVCPITRIPIKDIGQQAYPANDGYFYDKSSLTTWLGKSDLSPMTRQALVADRRVLVGPKTMPSIENSRLLRNRQLTYLAIAVVMGGVLIGMNAKNMAKEIDSPKVVFVHVGTSFVTVMHASLSVVAAVYSYCSFYHI